MGPAHRPRRGGLPALLLLRRLWLLLLRLLLLLLLLRLLMLRRLRWSHQLLLLLRLLRRRRGRRWPYRPPRPLLLVPTQETLSRRTQSRKVGQDARPNARVVEGAPVDLMI